MVDVRYRMGFLSDQKERVIGIDEDSPMDLLFMREIKQFNRAVEEAEKHMKELEDNDNG